MCVSCGAVTCAPDMPSMWCRTRDKNGWGSLAAVSQTCCVRACQALDMWGWSFLGAAGKVCQRNIESAWWATGSQAHKSVQRAAMAVTVAAGHRAVLQLPGAGAGVQRW